MRKGARFGEMPMPQPCSVKLKDNVDAILDLMEDGIYLSDRSGLTLRVNKAYQQIIGRPRGELEGKTVQYLQKQGVFNRILNPVIVKTRKPASVVQEMGMEKKNVLLRGFPILDEKGEVCLVVTFARDITSITQLREQIAEQSRVIEQHERRMSRILGSAGPVEGVFRSAAIRDVLQTLERVAKTDVTVLLLGETGVGKDVLARMMHAQSPRRHKMFLKVDCCSIAENLIESELFGYVRGAFSGASSQGREGYFEMADGGTVFLDEVGEISLAMQAKLLRVLQDKEFMKLGSSRPQQVDVRIIAATNRDLDACVAEGRFRQDLYYRLSVAKLEVPPLRERREDIPLLAEYFLEQCNAKYKKRTRLSAGALQALDRYSWPGNVRELQNMILQLVITNEHELLDVKDLPVRARPSRTEKSADCSAEVRVSPNAPKSLKETMAEVEYALLCETVRECGSYTVAAELFRINRSTLFRKLRRFNPGLADTEEGNPRRAAHRLP
ncbi:MAG: sigma 54-interacting transcriptional regulator [Desulfovibrio sp.]|jgi:PAS domain S-box-containing protein|nr:sigma 54-interacting transcriptional regulator [Desulfovibrio sp.]